jgi:hypothetical protein
MNLSPLPIQKFFDNDGAPLVGGLLYTYVVGTSTKIATYKDQAGTLNTNPVVLDYRGEANVWLDQTLVYKFVLAPRGDTDPPTKPIWTVDNVSAAVTFASLTASIIGQILYPRTAAEITAGVTPTNYRIPSNDYGRFILARYGADPTGVASSNTAWASLMAVVTAAAHGGVIEVYPGDYKFTSQATLTANDVYRIAVLATGARFFSTGAISTLLVTGGSTIGGVDIYGLQIDNHGDASCYAGINVRWTSRVRCYGVHVRVGGNSATYAPFIWENSDPNDDATSPIWGLLQDCSVRRLTNADGTVPNFDVILRGPCNSFEMRGGQHGDAMTVVRVEPHPTKSSVANGVVIYGVALEHFVTGFEFSGAAGSEFGGFRAALNRFEPNTDLVGTKTMFSFLGSTTQPAWPAQMALNYGTPDIATYFNNPNSLRAMTFDSATNPVIAPTLDMGGVLTLRNRSGNLGILDLQTGVDGAGIVLREDGGTTVVTMRVNGAGTGVDFFGQNSASLALANINSISSSGTLAKNLAGTDAFVGAATTRTVTFATAEPDASYRVTLQPTSDWGAQTKIPWITAKGTAGFTVNTSATTGGGTFDWKIERT